MEKERDRGEWLTLACVHQMKLFGLKEISQTKKQEESVVRITFFFRSDVLEDNFMKSI